MVGSGASFDVVFSCVWVDDVVALDLEDALIVVVDVVGASVIVVVVVVGVVDGEGVGVGVVVAVVVVVVSGSTSGGSTCMVIDSCLEHGLVAPSVAVMTRGNLPTVRGETIDDIRPEVESMLKVSRTTFSVLAAKLMVTFPLSPKSTSVTSTTTTVVLTSVDMLTKWILPESGLRNSGQ